MNTFEIGTRRIGRGHPAFIIAEMAWSHDGSADKARKICAAAAGAGADAISIHMTHMPDYMVRHYGNPGTVSTSKATTQVYDYLERINPNLAEWRTVADIARKTDMALCIMPNDRESFRQARTLEPDAWVVAASCFVEADLVGDIAADGRPVILRIGGATLSEIEQTVETLREAGADELLLLHGHQAYPTDPRDTHLSVIPTLGAMLDCPVGLADHIDGASPLALSVPQMALAIGAVAIEKHITWDRQEKGEDYEAALDPPLFTRFVDQLRTAEAALGTGLWPEISESIARYRQVSRKRVVAAMDLAPGTVIERKHLACKRSDEGAPLADRDALLGRTVMERIIRDGPVTLDRVSQVGPAVLRKTG